MIESRCGLLCSECSYREEVSCPGCLNMTKPFWGESCPLMTCCKTRERQHCGECDDFPCDKLRQFAYDAKQGDNGRRIEQCKKWGNE
ncbi:DUF3795 domain-containing protein [Anaerolentibacter hominis]|uniref:DUF3795 domain-containing protein n=1 Tax=Anaerolentibacter hominis TaxID=3079009 RepID=UPI0031B897E5